MLRGKSIEIEHKCTNLYDALCASVVLQTANRRALAEGNLRNAYLPEAYGLKALREIHADLDDGHRTTAAVRIELTKCEWPQITEKGLTWCSRATDFIINCRRKIFYRRILQAFLLSVTHCAVRCFVRTTSVRHSGRRSQRTRHHRRRQCVDSVAPWRSGRNLCAAD